MFNYPDVKVQNWPQLICLFLFCVFFFFFFFKLMLKKGVNVANTLNGQLKYRLMDTMVHAYMQNKSETSFSFHFHLIF